MEGVKMGEKISLQELLNEDARARKEQGIKEDKKYEKELWHKARGNYNKTIEIVSKWDLLHELEKLLKLKKDELKMLYSRMGIKELSLINKKIREMKK